VRPAASDKNKRAHLLSASLQSASPLLQSSFINDDVVSADVMESKSLPLPPDEAPSSPSAWTRFYVRVFVSRCVSSRATPTPKSGLHSPGIPSQVIERPNWKHSGQHADLAAPYQGMPRPPHCLILPFEARTDCNASSYLSPPQFFSI
jgi:hypothetical protein